MDEMEKDDKETFLEKYSTHIFLGVVLFTACVFAFSVYYKFSDSIAHIPNNVEDWAQVGDFFGGILNPTFSFLALIALLYTIILQSKELRLTRKELEASKGALQSQSNSLKLQNFENTFFNLLNRHTQTISFLMVHNFTGYKSLWQASKGVEKNLIHSKETFHSLKFIKHLSRASKITFEDYDMYRLLNESLDIIDCIQKNTNQLKKDELNFYVNTLKRQYSKFELMFFYLFMLNEKEIFLTYKDFLVEHNFFSKLRVGIFDELPDDLEDIVGGYGDNNDYVNYIESNHD